MEGGKTDEGKEDRREGGKESKEEEIRRGGKEGKRRGKGRRE